jgi:P-type Ca2+ transporter type 2C
MDAAEALAVLGSSRRGLGEDEAARRRAVAGPNTLPRPRRRPVAAELAAQLANMFAVVLMVAAGLTFLIYFLSSPRNASNLVLAFGILGVVVLNALIGFVQEHAAERTAEALQAMVPHAARVLRGGQLTEIGAEDLVPGDVLVLQAGDAVSADARVIEAHSLAVEMAALTGESQPSGRTAEPARSGIAAAEARDGVFMGTSVTTGTGKAVVFATGLGTEFGRIYRLTAELPAEQSPLQRQVSDMARRVAAVAIGTGTLLFALRVLTGNPAAMSFVFALGVMVALVPEGLPATLSVSLAIGVRRMARRQALIKKLAAVEALGSTTVICTDKTGTLTKAEMTVQQVYASGRVHKVTGTGYAPEGEVEDAAAVADLLRAAALCCDARLLAPSGTGAGGPGRGVGGARRHHRGRDPGRGGQGRPRPGRRDGANAAGRRVPLRPRPQADDHGTPGRQGGKGGGWGLRSLHEGRPAGRARPLHGRLLGRAAGTAGRRPARLDR